MIVYHNVIFPLSYCYRITIPLNSNFTMLHIAWYLLHFTLHFVILQKSHRAVIAWNYSSDLVQVGFQCRWVSRWWPESKSLHYRGKTQHQQQQQQPGGHQHEEQFAAIFTQAADSKRRREARHWVETLRPGLLPTAGLHSTTTSTSPAFKVSVTYRICASYSSSSTTFHWRGVWKDYSLQIGDKKCVLLGNIRHFLKCILNSQSGFVTLQD